MLSRCKTFIACQTGSASSIHYRCGFRVNPSMQTKSSTASASSILSSINLLSSHTRVLSLQIPQKSSLSCLNGSSASTLLSAPLWIHQHHSHQRHSSHLKLALNIPSQNTPHHAVGGELSMNFLLGSSSPGIDP